MKYLQLNPSVKLNEIFYFYCSFDSRRIQLISWLAIYVMTIGINRPTGVQHTCCVILEAIVVSKWMVWTKTNMLVTTYYCCYIYDGRSDANVSDDNFCNDYIHESQWW